MGKHGVLTKISRDRFLYLLAMPGLCFFILFKYLPMWGIIIAFQDYSPYRGITGSEWIGFEYFTRFFSNPDFLLLFRNTLAINLLGLTCAFPFSIIMAIMLNELRQQFLKRTIQTIVYLPHFLSWVIIVGITYLLLSETSGIVNKLAVSMGFSTIDFMTNPNYFWGLLVGQSIWKDAGWGTIIYLAAISGVDMQLYEAARMDGAGRLRQIWHITLPAIRPVIIILLILNIGNIMDVGFEHVFLMSNPIVMKVADVFDTYVYRVGIQQGEFGFSTAVGLFKSAVGLLLIVGANRLAKQFGEEGVY